MYSPTSSLIDPPAHNPIADGVVWVQGVALGSVATTVAVVAVAAIGLLMLSGRLELRRGITVVVGCFLLLSSGAVGVAIAGISGAGAPSKAPDALTVSRPRANDPGVPIYDPYAGASVPAKR